MFYQPMYSYLRENESFHERHLQLNRTLFFLSHYLQKTNLIGPFYIKHFNILEPGDCELKLIQLNYQFLDDKNFFPFEMTIDYVKKKRGFSLPELDFTYIFCLFSVNSRQNATLNFLRVKLRNLRVNQTKKKLNIFD